MVGRDCLCRATSDAAWFDNNPVKIQSPMDTLG